MVHFAALNGAGNPRISDFDQTNGVLKYARRDGTVWHAEIVDRWGLAGRHTSLALDGAGNPRISYYDSTNSDLKYARRDGTGWHAETVDPGHVGNFARSRWTARGTPASATSTDELDLRYAWRDGTAGTPRPWTRRGASGSSPRSRWTAQGTPASATSTTPTAT